MWRGCVVVTLLAVGDSGLDDLGVVRHRRGHVLRRGGSPRCTGAQGTAAVGVVAVGVVVVGCVGHAWSVATTHTRIAMSWSDVVVVTTVVVAVVVVAVAVRTGDLVVPCQLSLYFHHQLLFVGRGLGIATQFTLLFLFLFLSRHG